MGKRGKLLLVPAIHRATHRISVYLERDARLGITQAEAHILSHLWTDGDSTVAQLHSAFGHRRSTLTSILDRLANRGFIGRQASPSDRRTFVISLTAEGKKQAEQAFNALRALEEEIVAEVNRSQLSGFSAVVEAITSFSPKKRT